MSQRDPDFGAAAAAVMMLIAAVALAVAGATALILMSGCATPHVKPSRPTAQRPFTNCEAIVSGLCSRVERCTGMPAYQCLTDAMPACATMTGVTDDEVIVCTKAMDEERCTQPVPDACQGIADADASPAQKGIDL